MKTPFLSFLFFLVILGACISDRQPAPVIDYSLLVNPFIGTDFTGNTYPGAQAPFGMVQLSPDNGLPGWDRISGPALTMKPKPLWAFILNSYIRMKRLPQDITVYC